MSSDPDCGGPAAQRRVLVVDDNTDAADLLALFLQSVGHEVRVAYDGPQALALLTEYHPDVAVLDLGLPTMDGYELATAVSSRWPDVRLIALTGYSSDSDRARTHAVGFAGHLVKPVRPAALLEMLQGSAVA